MRTLIVGIGALGGVVAARMEAAGASVHLATRSTESAHILKARGLHVTGVGGEVSAGVHHVAPVQDYLGHEPFELIVIATKAADALDVAPALQSMLKPNGIMLPIQNGGVAQLLAARFGECVMGGLSNLGATMTAPGVYEQRNAGHLLIGELATPIGDRAERVQRWLGGAVEIKVTQNITGAIWSKLLVNCSVTTIGAVAGRTMREYIYTAPGRELFDRAYDEALTIALATGARPAPMLVDPVPPGWAGHSVPGAAHTAWLEQIVAAYGDLKPSMLQDFERGRTTEIEFINGYVAALGRTLGLPTPANDAIVATVHAITAREMAPGPANLTDIVARVAVPGAAVGRE